MVEDFQESLDRWSGGLIATGGALAPEKSFCYIINFEWTTDQWQYRLINKLPRKFTILDHQGQRQPLQRFEVDHADKTLGVYISMDGNKDTKLEYLRSMSKTFDAQMKSSKFTKNIALYTYNFEKSILSTNDNPPVLKPT